MAVSRILARPAMGMLPARHYVSEHTQFIREVLEEKPQVAVEQRKGRAMAPSRRPGSTRPPRGT